MTKQEMKRKRKRRNGKGLDRNEKLEKRRKEQGKREEKQ